MERTKDVVVHSWLRWMISSRALVSNVESWGISRRTALRTTSSRGLLLLHNALFSQRSLRCLAPSGLPPELPNKRQASFIAKDFRDMQHTHILSSYFPNGFTTPALFLHAVENRSTRLSSPACTMASSLRDHNKCSHAPCGGP